VVVFLLMVGFAGGRLFVPRAIQFVDEQRRLQQEQALLHQAQQQVEETREQLRVERQQLAQAREQLEAAQARARTAAAGGAPAAPPAEVPTVKPVVPPPPPVTSPAPPAPEKAWRNSIGMEFLLIPAGEFQMGSNNGDSDEKPVHKVRLSKAFYLGKYEVTQAQWQAMMGNNPSRFTGDDRRPVEQVSWEDTQEFIKRLNVKEGGTKYRLPTEAEWEYAARAGTTTAYSFGDDPRQLGEYAWFYDNAGQATHPVGQKKPNPWGLYDMHGNVWEWVQDWYAAYSAGTAVDPAGPAAGSSRVLRGGGWFDNAVCCLSAFRGRDAPGGRSGFLGLRLLREVP
jgi:formylglycine-generating enzyme required for sulfatase activity